MSDQPTMSAEERLDQLRQVISQAKGVPMSASCVVNRAELFELVEQIQSGLPEELGQARGVLADSGAQADRIVRAAREQAMRMTEDHEIVREARTVAEKIQRETAAECAALREEADLFIDSRMASFESVLHKTTSQVATARKRLAERSSLDAERHSG